MGEHLEPRATEEFDSIGPGSRYCYSLKYIEGKLPNVKHFLDWKNAIITGKDSLEQVHVNNLYNYWENGQPPGSSSSSSGAASQRTTANRQPRPRKK